MGKVTTAIRQQGKPDENNEKHVVIRVTYNRVPTKFKTGYKLTPDDFKKIDKPHVSEKLDAIRKKIKEEHERVKGIIESINPFTFQAFREQFYIGKEWYKGGCKTTVAAISCLDDPQFIVSEYGQLQQINPPPSTPTKIRELIREMAEPQGFTFSGHTRMYGTRKHYRIRSNVDYTVMGPLAEKFGDYIRELEMEERIGTSEGYFTTLMSLLEFRPGLRIEDINKDFLLVYERWMKNKVKKGNAAKKGNTETTIGIYLRNLRCIFNQCIDDGQISRDLYPFGKGRKKYQIPTGPNTKKALDLSLIKLLFDYDLCSLCDNAQLGKDMWFFLFYGNGMNPKDLAHLKYKDIDGDYIRFVREKTKNTTKSQPRKITVRINADMWEIIKRWGNLDTNPESYIFPVLKPGLSAHRVKELIQLFVKCINKWVGFIAGKVGIKQKVCCMEARHSFATILKRNGVSAEYIMEALGHQSLDTTRRYLASFEDEMVKKNSAILENFKQEPAAPAAATPETVVFALTGRQLTITQGNETKVISMKGEVNEKSVLEFINSYICGQAI